MKTSSVSMLKRLIVLQNESKYSKLCIIVHAINNDENRTNVSALVRYSPTD